MKIYTKAGDQGTTGLLGPDRVSKTDPRIDMVGNVDELNAWLGMIAAECSESSRETMIKLQRNLHQLGSDIASVDPENRWRITEKMVKDLEQAIDVCNEELKPLTQFILMGGAPVASKLFVARAVCRRAERSAVLCAQKLSVNPMILRYLNRLSDLLFTLARYENHKAGIQEDLWKF